MTITINSRTNQGLLPNLTTMGFDAYSSTDRRERKVLASGTLDQLGAVLSEGEHRLVPRLDFYVVLSVCFRRGQVRSLDILS